MPSTPVDKQDEEDRVVLSLLRRLRSQGEDAVLVERPDRLPESERTFPTVTSDALLKVKEDGTSVWWATDVMALAAPADHHLILEGLHDRLEPIARKYGVVIEIEGESPEIGDLKLLSKSVLRAIKKTPRSGSIDFDQLQISWRQPRPEDRWPVVIKAMTLPSPSPLLSEQVRDTIRNPLIKKATRQAQRARQAGCRAAVLIDWTGHADIAQGVHWLPRHSSTVKTAVEEVLSDCSHALDAVLLLDRDDTWHLLHGRFPTFAPVEPRAS